jgi:hypothetical protein
VCSGKHRGCHKENLVDKFKPRNPSTKLSL